MESRPFSKISIGDICEKCEMNRKSFYYHFKDKYDLVNWIYYTEFAAAIRRQNHDTLPELVEDLCRFFYGDRAFYRKIFSVTGQNSFSEYFRELLAAFLSGYLEEEFSGENNFSFYVDFYADAVVCAVKRWLLEKDSMPAEEFSAKLKKCLPVSPDRQ